MVSMNNKVCCPHCGEEMFFDDYIDIFDTEVDTLAGEYIEKAVFSCEHCEEEFNANIHYHIKFKRITY